ncbi:MAG: TRAFAC clade GTPase domain-containing protein [Rhodanobacter sp.]
MICANPDCRIAETGKCVEGLDTGTCPHFGHAPAEAGEVATALEKSAASKTVRLLGAGTLTVADTARLVRAGDVRIIAIIGPSDAGKTSLIASLYDLFQEGPVLGVEYARSLTLHAFEQTCHDARAASRRNVPHINRTPRGEIRFYHLDLGGGPAGDALALALGDRAGEEYRSAADDASIVTSFPEVLRADSLTLLVDGERFLDAGARHNLRSEITMMLQALVDGGAIQTGQRLALVLTKIDLVQASPNLVRVERDFSGLLARLNELFGNVFCVIQSFRIAASPKTDALRRGTGLPDLLAFWLGPAAAAPTPPPSRTVPARAFARLQPFDTLEG